MSASNADRATYMRAWSAKNCEHIAVQRAARLSALKEDPSAYAAYREKANARTRLYAANHRDDIRAKAKEVNHRYTPERGVEIRAKYGPRYVVREVIKAARCRAGKRGLAFDLTEEWYEGEFAKGCAVTGMPLEKPGCRGPWAAHVDRKLPSDGYTQRNCRLVCAVFNLAKKNWTDDDVLRMATALVAATR